MMKRKVLGMMLVVMAMVLSTTLAQSTDNSQETNQSEQKAPKQLTLNAFEGATVIIPEDNPDQQVQIDRRDVVDYAADVPPDERRVILKALKKGVAKVVVTKPNEKPITYTVNVKSTADADEQQKADLIEQMVNDKGLEISFVGDDKNRQIVLQGEVEDELTVSKALTLAEAYFPQHVLNFVQIREPLQIRVKIKVVQITYTKDSNIGMQYRADPSSPNALRFPLNINTAAAKLLKPEYPFFTVRNTGTGVADLSALFNFYGNETDVKVLQEPTITVLNGQAATFLVGQSIPYISSTTLSSTGSTQNVTFLPVGIQLIITPLAEDNNGYVGGSTATSSASSGGASFALATPSTKTLPQRNYNKTTEDTITPTIDRNGMIRLFVRPEVSSLISMDTVSTSPTITAPRTDVKFVETRVALKNDESLILGGLFDDESTKNFEKLPFLSEIPILGEFFKNRNTDKTRKELVFVLTPDIVGREQVAKGEDYQPKLSEMYQLLNQNDVKILGAKPTRISAAEVGVRPPEEEPALLREGLKDPSMMAPMPLIRLEEVNPKVEVTPGQKQPTDEKSQESQSVQTEPSQAPDHKAPAGQGQ
jgi:Flp pilus assembly secretin CpaC